MEKVGRWRMICNGVNRCVSLRPLFLCCNSVIQIFVGFSILSESSGRLLRDNNLLEVTSVGSVLQLVNMFPRRRNKLCSTSLMREISAVGSQ